jgi:hypothetical protein
VAATGTGTGPATVHFSGIPADFGAVAPTLECRVLPGFAKDDAFVLIAPDPGKDKDVAFDNLMQVLKSDLGEPLREAQLRLNRVRESRDGKEPGEVDQLFDGVGELVSLMDRVADLAAIWGSGALLDSDRIELWDLLMKAWAQAEPLALSRGVESAARLRKAFEDRGPAGRAELLMAMARGPTDAELESGADAVLVESLSDPALVVRRYALACLVEIVGPSAFDRGRFRPDGPEESRRDAIGWWRSLLDKGGIRRSR